MNASSHEALEFPRLRDWLATLTSFSAGRERSLALTPSGDAQIVSTWLDQTDEMFRLSGSTPELGLGGVHDVRPAVARAGLGAVLGVDELLAIEDTLTSAERWIAALRRQADQFPTLARLVDNLETERTLRVAIGAAIGEDGQVLDAASDELRRIRASLRAAQDRLLRRLQEIVSSSRYRSALQEPIVTQRDGRYVLPVKSESRGQLRGVVHDQSASGATLFVEPFEVVELSNRWRQLQREEAAEIERVLRNLSQQVGERADNVESSVEALADLDLIQAKARLSESLAATRPQLGDPLGRDGLPPLRLIAARHPLLERTIGRQRVVPIDLELGSDTRILLITGPNTGGKTVALKTIGLLALMAQSGLHVPAGEGSRVPVLDGVYADVGDEQSIEQSLSTFSSHIVRIVEMLQHADSQSLVLIDELGAGTDPDEGAALARSLLEELRARGCLVVGTTHYSELKAYAHSTPGVQNASVEFDVETLTPTFRLQVGMPGRSNALAIASRLGMPEHIVERARTGLRPAEQEVSGLIERLQAQQASVEEETRQAEQAAADADRLRARYEQALEEIEERRRAAWDEAEAESDRLLSELRSSVRALERRLERASPKAPDAAEVAEAAAAARRLAPLRRPAAVHQPATAAPLEPELRVGSGVFVPTLGVNATILSLVDDDTVEIGVGSMRVLLPRAQVERSAGGEPSQTLRPEPRPVELDMATRDVPLEIDLRGLRRDEAIQTFDRYLHDAYMAGLPSVRVIHGRGTGAVRTAVHEVLVGNPLVKSFTVAGRSEGGDGATNVSLAV